MHKPTLALLIGLAFILQPGRAVAQVNDIHSVSIRIHDYARTPRESIEWAQKYVAALYARIDVHIAWRRAVRPNEWRVHFRDRDPGELLINILPPAMSRHLEVTEETLGVAAVTQFDGGTVAYVLSDRICDVATTSQINAADVLAVVIAHELGHLLLPAGSHSPSGLMRPALTADDFKPLNQQQLNFTSAQADAIRGMISRRPSSAAVSLQTAGQ